MLTTVVNIRYEKHDVYIGRAGHGQDGTFGNPFSDGTRSENIARFKVYFYDRLKKDPVYRQKVLALRGKSLGCFCVPQECHGHVIADYLNSLSPKIYAVIGSRSFNNYDFLKETLDWYDIKEIVSGGAKGADSLAKQYAAENGILCTEFLPDWNTHGKSAGYIRNKLIINRADEVIAFWDRKSKGTEHSINIASEQGKPCYIYWPEQQDDLACLGL